ncbi:MAG: ATP-binding protein [Bacteroidales bacterium]|nr:ATP-binding protein [Bacteroidales bacterium]
MAKRIFKRKIYSQILQWKEENDGSSALLVEGARRVGKSTIVEEFARQEYESYILIDFNKASKAIKSLFDDLMDLDYIFLVLQQTYKKTLSPRKSVIIFDEVQKCPMARQAIKYLVQDGRYDYIETGSLISIKKNTDGITIPSEEDRVQMLPMDYEEFRWALSDESTVPMLRKFWEMKKPLGPAHRNTQRDLRLYMLVGGMPQAVNTYLDTNNLKKVDAAKRKIIKLYADDFRKIDPTGRITRLFLSIPGQISNNESRYQPTTVLGNIDNEKMSELLTNLEDSKTVNFAYHSNDPNVGMELTKDDKRFKLFVADTGLFVTMAFWDKRYTENVIYEKLLSDKLSANIGYVYENLIAQILTASGNKLFYYTWPKDEKHNYEIDFLLSRGAKIDPIEVKASGYKTHVSLDDFCSMFSSRIRNRYLVYTKDLNKEDQIVLVPVYMTPFL